MLKFIKNKGSRTMYTSTKIYIILALALATPATAKQKQVAPYAETHAVLLYDYSTNRVVEGKNIHQKFPVASITKLMTAYVVLESNADLDEKLKVIHFPTETSRVLINGTFTTRRELLHMALIASDNKAAKMLAHYHPAGHLDFIVQMNLAARSMGMMNTYFYDSTGLSVFNVSTAWDLHLMNKAIVKYSIFNDTAMSKTSTQQATTRRGKLYKFIIRNTSALAGEYDIRVGKTGFTNAARWCISMQVRLNGHSFDAIVLGSPSKTARNALVKDIITAHIGRLAGTVFNIEQIDQITEY